MNNSLIKVIFFLYLLINIKPASFAQAVPAPPYKNASLLVEQRVNDLLKRMSLSEKIAQMRHIHGEDYDINKQVDFAKLSSFTNGLSFGCIEAFPYSSLEYAKAIALVQTYMKEKTRLGIPVIPVMEGLHGTVQDGSTIYPQSIGIAATFNPAFTFSMADLIGMEIKHIGIKQVLAPDLDLARELRWGRVEETYGEDPFLVSEMATAYVKGLRKHNIICTPKHFIGHGSPVGGLNLASVEGGKRLLLSLYLQPFEKVIKEADPLSIMNCYSSYDGEPVTGSYYMMTDLLRHTLGFKGYVYSDWGSVAMLSYFHKTAKGPEGAAKQAVEAGIDLEAGGSDYAKLEQLINKNQLDIKYIDSAVSHILYAKFVSGLFEDALPDTLNLDKYIHTPSSISLAKTIADESAVLLKNDQVLPFDLNKLKTLAVIGPNADQVQFGDYTWSRNNKDGVTPLKGIQALAAKNVKINYARGCDLVSQDKSGFDEAVKAVTASDAAVIFVGSQSASLAREYKNSTSGEGFDLSDLKLPGVQEELVEAVQATGKPVVVVLVTGKPFAVPWIKRNANAVIVQWYGGEQQGNAIADILFGKVNPSGKLPVSFPQSVGHLPVYYNHFASDKGYYKQPGSVEHPGRDYVFSSPDALWAFGYGLSYTKFTYANMSVSKNNFALHDTIEVTVDITNAGSREGKEVVQLYVNDLVSSVATPVQQLKAFKKVSLQTAETKQVILRIPIQELYLYNKDYKKVVEPGEFELQLGSSSDKILFRKIITVSDSTTKNNLPAEKEHTDKTIASDIKVKTGKQINVTGLIRDVQATVIPGIKVSIKDSDKYTIANDKGEYAIKARTDDVLVFSGKGYMPQEVSVTGNKIINVKLLPSQNSF
ncbi:glycoside hydrolase family 3 N-terminal domain-containing protein [Chitinophagaceae bacterium LWZ2-11]